MFVKGQLGNFFYLQHLDSFLVPFKLQCMSAEDVIAELFSAELSAINEHWCFCPPTLCLVCPQ